MRRAPWLVAACSLGCTVGQPKPDSGGGPFFGDPPVLEGVSITCDPVDGQWALEVRTAGWMGFGRVWWGTSPDTLESVDIVSRRADARGAWDCGAATVPMAADVQSPSSGTRYRCSEAAELHIHLAVTEATGSTWADCRTTTVDGGPWQGVRGVPSCSTTFASNWAGDVGLQEGDVSECP